jgi:hypothetical protein
MAAMAIRNKVETKMKKFKCSGHFGNTPVTVYIPAISMDECIQIIDGCNLDLRPDSSRTSRVLARVGAFLKQDGMVELGIYFFYLMAGMIINEGLRDVRTLGMSTPFRVFSAIMTILVACIPVSLGNRCLKVVKKRAQDKDTLPTE